MEQKQLEKIVATIVATQDNNFKYLEDRIIKIEKRLLKDKQDWKELEKKLEKENKEMLENWDKELKKRKEYNYDKSNKELELDKEWDTEPPPSDVVNKEN